MRLKALKTYNESVLFLIRQDTKYFIMFVASAESMKKYLYLKTVFTEKKKYIKISKKRKIFVLIFNRFLAYKDKARVN